MIASGPTDLAGAYSLTVPAGTYQVAFDPPQTTDFVGQLWNNKTSPLTADPVTVSATQPAPALGVNAQLAHGYVLSGTLTNASTGAPIAAGRVGAYTPVPPNTCCPQLVGRGTADLNGTFHFAVPAGTYILRVLGPSSPTYVPVWYGGGANPSLATQFVLNATTPNAGVGLALQLQPGFVISGHVQDAAATALAGVNVSVIPPTGGSILGSAQTDALGNYAIVVAAGSYKVQFNKAGFAAQLYSGTADFNAATVLIVSADTPNINAALAPGFVISGHVQDAATAALAGVFVGVSPVAGGSGFGATTDASGNYAIPVGAGSYKVQFNKTGYVRQYYNGTTDVNAATVLAVSADAPGINATLATGFTISGHVQDAATAALAGVNVSVFLPTGGSSFGSAQTDASGNYAITVAAGSYKVRFIAAG